MLNLRHNALKHRPTEEDIYTIGWLDDLPRYTIPFSHSGGVKFRTNLNISDKFPFLSGWISNSLFGNKLLDFGYEQIIVLVY